MKGRKKHLGESTIGAYHKLFSMNKDSVISWKLFFTCLIRERPESF